jgi:putative thioredoxin
MLKSILMQGDYSQVKKIIIDFPPSTEYAQMQVIHPLFDALRNQETHIEPDSSIEAVYQNCLNLIRRGNLPAAMDGLIDILRQDKHYRDDEVRKVILGLFEVLGNNHPLRQYRQELAMVLLNKIRGAF